MLYVFGDSPTVTRVVSDANGKDVSSIDGEEREFCSCRLPPLPFVPEEFVNPHFFAGVSWLGKDGNFERVTPPLASESGEASCQQEQDN